MKKILQVFKKLFKRKQKTYYVCDPKKATECDKFVCWEIMHGPCKCTSKKECAKTDLNGLPIIATDMDLWNVDFNEMLAMKIKEGDFLPSEKSQKKQGL